MKTLLISIALIAICSFTQAQHNYRLGASAGIIQFADPNLDFSIEISKQLNESMSIFNRADLGFAYRYEDYFTASFGITRGYRLMLTDVLFLEQSLGLGLMKSFYNEDVWHVKDNRSRRYIPGSANLDLCPSIEAAMGFKTKNGSLLSIRPQVFWQLSTRQLSEPFLDLQLTYSFPLNPKN